jgi:hypothetical protein
MYMTQAAALNRPPRPCAPPSNLLEMRRVPGTGPATRDDASHGSEQANRRAGLQLPVILPASIRYSGGLSTTTGNHMSRIAVALISWLYGTALAFAQEPSGKLPTIGWISPATTESYQQSAPGSPGPRLLRKTLARHGLIDGKNMRLEMRLAEGRLCPSSTRTARTLYCVAGLRGFELANVSSEAIGSAG